MAALWSFAIVRVRTNFRFSQHTIMLRLAHVETFGLIGEQLQHLSLKQRFSFKLSIFWRNFHVFGLICPDKYCSVRLFRCSLREAQDIGP